MGGRGLLVLLFRWGWWEGGAGGAGEGEAENRWIEVRIWGRGGLYKGRVFGRVKDMVSLCL